ncbi:MAG: restriction endonuclease subunit S [Nitrospirae bacterium]|nr:restriction endonuclease subunit S [Nitrospirota bacterium]
MNLNNVAKLPDGWRWVRLGEVCEEKTGTKDPRLQPKDTFRYVDISSVGNNQKRILGTSILLGKDAPSRARQVIKAGDVIVSTTRPNLNAVALVPHELDNQICSTGFCVLRPKKELERNFLFAYVCSPNFVKNLSDLVKGALYPAVTDKQVKAQVIPLPPLPEQKRIAAILNEQMAAVEKARVAAEAQVEAAKTLPGAYLRKVFEKEKAKKWPKKRCQEIIEVRDGTHDTPKYVDKGIPLVTSKNLKSSGLDFSNVQYISQEDHEQIKRRSKVDVGDILFAMIGTIGNPVIVNTDREFSIKNVGLFKINKSPINRDFLFFLLQSSIVTRQLDKSLQGGIQKFASLNVLRNLIIPFPPLAEQKSIALILYNQITGTDRLRKSIEDQLETIKSLPPALLRQAFSGEL